MNSHLRTKTTTETDGKLEPLNTARRHSDARLGGPPVLHRIAPPFMRNFDHVRENIRTHSRGIFSTRNEQAPVAAGSKAALPELPQRAEFACLSRSYLDSIHNWYPILHWPTFHHEVDEVYTSRSFEAMSKEWIALFFAVLACGSLQSGNTQYGPASRGTFLFEVASQALTPWSHEITIEHAQAALLLSVFAAENNWRSVGSIWLSSAVRVAQELSIHCDGNTGSVVDVEIRRRLWWAMYTRDR
jgi:hypothetical protein